MKHLILGLGTMIFALSLSATAQMRDGSCQRGSCDKARDGKCNTTGQQMGQRRGKGTAAMRNGGGCQGQQNNCCRKGQSTMAQPNSAPAPKN